MCRRCPPDHRDPGAFAGLSMRLRERATLPHVDLGEGQRRFKVAEEAERLRGLSLGELRKEAEVLDLDPTLRERGDLDAMRRAILERKLNVSLGGEA